MTGAHAPTGAAPPISARGVTVAFDAHSAVLDVSLDVPSGQTLAILGANGSGKSTLVRALLGLEPLAAGSVEVFGVAVGPRGRRRVPWHRVGYVPQRTTAAGSVGATAREVVASGLLHEARWRPPRGAAALVAEALDAVGLADQAGRAVAELSGGQQQRVLIARALVRDPDLLVLDEPLAGIDSGNQDAVAAVLDRMSDAGGTVIVVLHEPGVLASQIDRAVVLDKGCVTHDGAPPAAVGAHAMPGHDHVHPHAPRDQRRRGLTRGIS